MRSEKNDRGSLWGPEISLKKKNTLAAVGVAKSIYSNPFGRSKKG